MDEIVIKRELWKWKNQTYPAGRAYDNMLRVQLVDADTISNAYVLIQRQLLSLRFDDE